MSTRVYGNDRLAMCVDTLQRIDRVTAGRLVNEAAQCGVSRGHAAEVIGDVLDRVPDAADAAAADADVEVPTDVRRLIDTNLSRIRG